MEQNDQSANRTQNTNALFGILLIIIGLLFLLDQFHMFRLGALISTEP